MMSTLASFFHGADTHLGTFYPTHYLLASYPSLKEAQDARNQLVAYGYPRGEVIAVPGQDLAHLSAEHVFNDGLQGVDIRNISTHLLSVVFYTVHSIQFAT